MDTTSAKLNKILKSLDKSLADLVQVAQHDASDDIAYSFLEMECHNVFHRYVRYLVAVATLFYPIVQCEHFESIRKSMQQLREIHVLQRGLVHYYDPDQRMSLKKLKQKETTVLGAVNILQRCLESAAVDPTRDYKTGIQRTLDSVKQALTT